ncbi:MAG: O-antigen ligase family protein [bacterium]
MLPLLYLILPLVFTRSTMDPVLHLRFSILAGCLVLITAVTLLQSFGHKSGPGGGVFRHWIVGVSLAFLVMQTVAGVSTINHTEAIFAVAKTLVKVSLFFILLFYLDEDDRLLLWICRAVVVGSLALAAIATLQYLGVAFLSLPGNHLPFATMANKNLLASALLLMLPLVAATWLTDRGIWQPVSLAVLGVDTVAIVLAHARATWLALAVAACFALVLVYWGHRRRMPWSRVVTARRTVFSLVAVTAVALMIGFAMLSAAPNTQRPDSKLPVNMSTSSLKQRLLLWDKSLAIARYHPLLGCGPGNWKLTVPAYGTQGLPSASGDLYFLRPHNEYLMVLSESGPITLACYLAILGLALYYGIRTMARTKSATEGLIALLMLTGLVGYMVVAGFSFPEERTVHPMLVGFMLAVTTLGYHKSDHQGRGIPTNLLRLGWVLVTVGLVAAGIMGWERWKSERHVTKAIAAQARQEWSTVRDETALALSWSAQIDPATNPLALYHGVSYLAQQNCDSALPWFEAAYRIHPNHLQVLNNYAYCLHTSGRLALAKELYHRAVNISPLPQTMINLAILYNQNGQPDSAGIWLDSVPDGIQDPRLALLRERLESNPSESDQ